MGGWVDGGRERERTRDGWHSMPLLLPIRMLTCALTHGFCRHLLGEHLPVEDKTIAESVRPLGYLTGMVSDNVV